MMDETIEQRHGDDDAPFAALAFKIATDPFVGTLTFFRVYSGKLESGTAVYNSVKQKKERVGRMVQMHSNSREEIKEVLAGDIAAAVGLKDVTTGDTLCDAGQADRARAHGVPGAGDLRGRGAEVQGGPGENGHRAGKLAQEDPSFRVKTDEETGQTIISGMGELHLDIIVDRMRREFSVEANIGKPQVAYREAIRNTSRSRASSFASPVVAVSTVTSGSSSSRARTPMRRAWSSSTRSSAVCTAEYIPAVQKGIEEQMQNGVLAGYPLLGLKATLYDGSFHDVDSNEMAFKIAASMATKKLSQQGGAVLLEPIMKVEVVTPEENMGDVVGDLNRRRGLIAGMDENPSGKVVNAEVPLAEMFGYATDLRSATQGRATYTMEFSKYSEAPNNIAEEIISKNQTN
jgi:elongation factor G